MENNTTQTVHKFEAAGLGKAPFKYIGMEIQDIAYGEAVISRAGGILVTTKPGGSCAYCGTYIVNMFNIESADGKKFHVGSECVNKTGDAGLKKVVAAEVRKMNTERRHAREKVQVVEGEAFIERADVVAFMKSMPSPVAWRAAKGDTYADYVAFALGNAGKSGTIRITRAVRKLFETAAAAKCDLEYKECGPVVATAIDCHKRAHHACAEHKQYLAGWIRDIAAESHADSMAAADFEERAYGRD
jgi:hypothetical protein